ncbi:hypothetical protein P7H20_16680 [Paenibacillus larvae]|nr:hypothetical protein [Paenibacillus larvae]MDT2276138.1 hypothetical protein [Paenibacillus larvae]
MLEVEYSKILKDIIMEVRELKEPTGKIEAEIWFDGGMNLHYILMQLIKL